MLTGIGKLEASLFSTCPLSEFHRAQTDFMARSYVGKLLDMPGRFCQPV